ARKQPVEDFILLRFVLIGRRGAVAPSRVFHRQRNDLLGGGNLRYDGLKAGIEQGADIELAGIESGQHFPCDVLGIDEAELTDRAQFDGLDDLLLEDATELLVAFSPDAEKLDLLA